MFDHLSNTIKRHFIVQLYYFTLLSPLCFIPGAGVSNSVQVTVSYDVLEILGL